MSDDLKLMGELLATELSYEETLQVAGGVVVTTMRQVPCPGGGNPDTVEVCGQRDSERVGY